MKYKILTHLLLVIFCSLGVSWAEDETESVRGLKWVDVDKNHPTPFLEGKYRAIVVGNNAYSDQKGIWKNLKTAVQGAKTVATLLQNDYGFSDVTLLLDVERKEILSALQKLSKRVEPNDSVLVYYAGHGYLEEDHRRGYWIPTDGQGFDNSTFIRNSTTRDEINIIAEKTKHTLLISDSCFSGSLLKAGVRGPRKTENIENYYKKVSNKKSVQVLAAGGNEFVDDSYRNSGQSPFTYFFVNELKNNTQRMISLSELASNLIKAVANNVEQTPMMGVLQGAGDELGDFVFARISGEDNVLEVVVGRDQSKAQIKQIVNGRLENKPNKNAKERAIKSTEPVFFPGFRF